MDDDAAVAGGPRGCQQQGLQGAATSTAFNLARHVSYLHAAVLPLTHLHSPNSKTGNGNDRKMLTQNPTRSPVSALQTALHRDVRTAGHDITSCRARFIVADATPSCLPPSGTARPQADADLAHCPCGTT
ncbi:hypothetical protein CDD83_9463 [Cordyceps sp. RAO-2017]|nr:hypothetical protein CDD83_9463 [Cordyceps sp. RAO-2017]